MSKCKIVHFGKGNIGYRCSMSGHALEEVATVKDLGVIFFSDLKSATHCEEAVNCGGCRFKGCRLSRLRKQSK